MVKINNHRHFSLAKSTHTETPPTLESSCSVQIPTHTPWELKQRVPHSCTHTLQQKGQSCTEKAARAEKSAFSVQNFLSKLVMFILHELNVYTAQRSFGSFSKSETDYSWTLQCRIRQKKNGGRTSARETSTQKKKKKGNKFRRIIY